MKKHSLAITLALAVALVYCGIPELAQAAQQQSAAPQEQKQQQNPAAQPGQGVTVDPSQGPLTPVPTKPDNNEAQPAPANGQPETVPAGPTPQTNTSQQQTQHEPLGAAAAEGVKTAGGVASRPAGSAIAPEKQHQTRSFLIKLGAVAAGAAALGAVFALSKGTPSTPPNSGH